MEANKPIGIGSKDNLMKMGLWLPQKVYHMTPREHLIVKNLRAGVKYKNIQDAVIAAGFNPISLDYLVATASHFRKQFPEIKRKALGKTRVNGKWQ